MVASNARMHAATSMECTGAVFCDSQSHAMDAKSAIAPVPDGATSVATPAATVWVDSCECSAEVELCIANRPTTTERVTAAPAMSRTKERRLFVIDRIQRVTENSSPLLR